MAHHTLRARLVRWMRQAAPGPTGRRRLLVVQIDGLSRHVLARALQTGRMPHLARMLRMGRLAMRPLSAGLPTSTPAFQASAMYGVMPDIPGFHYFDKREGRELHFPKGGVADLVEQRIAPGRRGILEGGACYGCVFTGGAEDALFTFARLMAPARVRLAWMRVPIMLAIAAWVVAKCLALSAVEILRFIGRLPTHRRRGWRKAFAWLGLRLAFSVWVRQFFTLAVCADVYRGTRAVYVNYLDYDVLAHAFGPQHRAALNALRRVDASIHQLARVVDRVPWLGYDLYVLSDHGQTRSRMLGAVTEGEGLDAVVREVLTGADASRVARADTGLDFADHLRAYRRGTGRLTRRRRRPIATDEAPPPKDGIRVIAAGPNGFVYFVDSPDPLEAEELELRHPGAAARLSLHPAIGLVLVRSKAGPQCWYRGRRMALEPGTAPRGPDPFAEREDRDLVLSGLRDLMAMPSAGDLVLYGNAASVGDVSFIAESGAHAGPSADEMQVFVLHPPSAPLPGAPLTHPIQLYPVFARYLD